ncbi:MAG: hypothetical protein HYZ33_00750 [Ignavibacteriales bacterium]|nr:hypothetical protein [Ignavibacteriales bacterium]
MKTLFTILPICLILMFGCQKPGPIELIDETTPPQAIEIDTTSNKDEVLNPNNSEIDSGGYFATLSGRAYGQIIIGGARYDAGTEHHTASIAQAIFFNQTQPLKRNNDTIGYHTINVGEMRINGLELFKPWRRFLLSSVPLRDTLVGPQYVLYNKDGIGGRGFEYEASKNYTWTASGVGNISPFSFTLKSTPIINVEAPLSNEVVSLTKNLLVKISGNVEYVTVFIRRKPLHPRDLDSKPILKFKVAKRGQGIIIPTAMLQSLPRAQNAFLFSFLVEKNTTTTISGYPTKVLVNASYVHHVLFNVKR